MWEPRRPVTARGRRLVDNWAARTRYGAEASGRGSRLHGVEGQHRHRGERLVRRVVGRAEPRAIAAVGDAVLHLHRAERADTLADALADLITEPPADPFTAEVVAVPARGMERWLAHRLAHRLGTASGRGDGVCAHVAFPAPGEVVATAVEGATGVAADDDPWHPARAVWPLLEVVDTCTGPAVVRSPGRSSGAGAQQVRGGRARHRAVRRLRHAPARAARRLARRRRRGRARGPALAAGAVAGAARADRRPGPGGAARPRRSPAASATRVAAPCRSGCRCSAPPACPADHLAVLAALAEHRDVHLWLPHPSPALWDRVAPVAVGVPARRADPTAELPRHPLLAALGRDVRELQLRLAGPPRRRHAPSPARTARR